MGSGGMELKHYHTLDGLGIAVAHRAGLRTAIITARESEAVALRAADLRVGDLVQGCLEKEQAYDDLLEKYGLRDEQVAYVGDDLVDLPAFRRAGLKVAVANARSELKLAADYVTAAAGGGGAVREVVELLLGWRPQGEAGSGEEKEI